jgi:hypothetical protein
MPRYDDYDDDDFTSRLRKRSRRPRAVRHSVLGIASLAIAILMGFSIFFFIVLSAIFSAQGPMNDRDPKAMVLGFGIIGSSALALVGGVLGVVGLFQPKRHKVFPIIGTIFNAILIFGVMFLMCIGLVMQR